jgi:hypothetical protein
MDGIVWMIYGVGVVDVYVYMDEWMGMCMEIWRAHYSYMSNVWGIGYGAHECTVYGLYGGCMDARCIVNVWMYVWWVWCMETLPFPPRGNS